MDYVHRWTNGEEILLASGKVVCVGRNYAEHAMELNNPIPSEPMLFIKPATSLVDITEPIHIDWEKGTVHHELELSVLIGNTLVRCTKQQAASAILGIGIHTLPFPEERKGEKGHTLSLPTDLPA